MEWAADAALRPEKVVGAIDTAAYLYAHLVQHAIPEARCFVLLRDPAQVQQSLNYAGMTGMDIQEAHAKLNSLPHPQIQYQNIGDAHYLMDLWETLNGTQCARAHLARFLELRIQRDPRLFLAHRPNLRPHLRSMLS